jgi:hypothetical protein
MKLQTIESDFPKSLDKFLEFVNGTCETDTEFASAYDYIENNLTDIFGDINLRVLWEFFDSQNVFIQFVVPYVDQAGNARFAFNVYCESPSLNKLSNACLNRYDSIEKGFVYAFDFLEFQKLT